MTRSQSPTAVLVEKHDQLKPEHDISYIATVMRKDASDYAAECSYKRLVNIAKVKYTSAEMKALLRNVIWKGKYTDHPCSADMVLLEGVAAKETKYQEDRVVRARLTDLQWVWVNRLKKDFQVALLRVHRDGETPKDVGTVYQRAVDDLVRHMNRRINRMKNPVDDERGPRDEEGPGDRKAKSSAHGRYEVKTLEKDEDHYGQKDSYDTPLWMLSNDRRDAPAGTHFEWDIEKRRGPA